MAWRTVVIANPARLKVEQQQLVIEQGDGPPITFPLEDIAVLLVESQQVTLTAALLARCASADVTLFVCDESHIPAFIGQPLQAHTRMVSVQRLQLSMSQPFLKRCWQLVVRQKILNQGRCLGLLAKPGEEQLKLCASKVASGDSANVEGWAAREFFREAYGGRFTRFADDGQNHALNYGYAVLRGAVARGITLHGLLAAHGMHHRSELNPFNLADDLIEPFRPLVDLYVAQQSASRKLDSDYKQKLVVYFMRMCW